MSMSYFHNSKDSGSYFVHDGVNGMKWGKRRYQNEDGTWTQEGLERRRAQYNAAKQPTWRKVARGVNAAGGIGLATAGAVAGTKVATKNSETRDRAFKPGKDDKPSSFQKLTNSSKNIVDETSKIDRQLKADNRDKIETDDLTNKELRDMIERLRLERDYKDLAYKDVNRGADKIKEVLEIVGGLAAIGASTATIITLIKGMKGPGRVLR